MSAQPMTTHDIYEASSDIARRGIVYQATAKARDVLTDRAASDDEAVKRALEILTEPKVLRASERLGVLPPPLA